MATPREKFQALLKKLFQFDNAELDFGIYRIMNHKRAVIERFIEKDLIQGLDKELKLGAHAEQAELARQLEEATAKIRENFGNDALDAEGNLLKGQDLQLGKDYLALRTRAGAAKSSPELEAEIFNHLYAFFSRYYDDGDFMSLRRYSRRDKYAIPYNGEEVHLHWANADQYYIKTGENFTDYSYKHGGWTVRFKLRNADVEQNNVKGAKRFFIPRAGDVELDAKARSLSIPFEYRPLNADEEIRYGKGGKESGAENGNGKPKAKKKGQEGILADAQPAIQQAAKKNPDALAALLHEKRKDSDGNPVTLLDHHLRAYTRSNTTDFFIHKDLKGFLERELDFYLKNEVLNLDELEAGGEARSESWFQTLRAIKAIGRQIIAFVAQIENFEKRLFEKRKFVTDVQYCVTLDRVPEKLYSEIVKNERQIEEWKRLFHIQDVRKDLARRGFTEPLKVEFLKEHQHLVVDTKFFTSRFTEELLASREFLRDSLEHDEAIDGILINSENYQALNILMASFRKRVDCFYLDPPYNTDASPIVYKNGYKESSWITLMQDRLALVARALKNDGTVAVAIDDTQQRELSFLLSKCFSGRLLGTFCVRSNPSGRPMQTGYSVAHEYVLYAGASPSAVIGRMPPTAEQMARFSERDQDGPFEWRNLRREGSNSDRSARRYLYYPLYITANKIRVPKMEWDDNKKEWNILESPKKGEVAVLPDNDAGQQKTWRWGHETVAESLNMLAVRKDRSGRDYIYYKRRPHEDGVVSVSTWFDAKYSATEHGTAVLKNLFGMPPFSYPKSVHAVVDSIYIGGASSIKSLVCDPFGGSGTTAHAVINLNRADGGSRKYVLIDVETYFESALKPRIQKVIYSADWKDGKPLSRKGSSHTFKYLRLESYEDALDNISFDGSESQAALELEDYMLSYMLDFETKSSDTLLNVSKLDAPFDYKLRRHGKDEPLAVDLPETFNYLIGLHVATRRVYENKGVRYLVYRGKAEGKETAVIWRTTRGWKKEEFEVDREFVAKQKLAEGAEDVFVNADSFIEGARSLDPVFKRRMFSDE